MARRSTSALRSDGIIGRHNYLPPFAYTNLQVLGQAVEATKSLDQDKLADCLRTSTFKTVVGDIKYGPNGEREHARVLQVQFHGVEGSDLEQWRSDDRQTIVWPPQYATGETVYPYADARK